MSRDYHTGFEGGDLSAWTVHEPSQVSVVTSPTPPSGTYMAELRNDGHIRRDLATPKQEVFLRCKWGTTDTQRGVDILYLLLTDGTYFALKASSAKFFFSRNGTTIATGTYDLTGQHGRMFELEVNVFIDNSVGIAKLKVEGNIDIDFSGDTQPSTATTITQYRLRGPAWASGEESYFDDFAINTADGTVNNSWCGPGRVKACRVFGAGTHTDFIPSAGSNYQNVDEHPPDGDGTYNESGIDGDKDSFSMESLGLTGIDINAVAISFVARKTVANGDRMRAFVRVGGTDYPGNDEPLTVAYERITAIWDQNPDTLSAWTVSDVNNIEAGYENRVELAVD